MEDQKDTNQEKTEPASSKKKQDARNKGKVAKSAEINSAIILMFGILFVYFAGAAIASHVAVFSQRIFASSSSFTINPTNIHHIFIEGLTVLIVIIGPIAISLLLIGLLTSYAQVGFLFTVEPMKPKFTKIDPLKGIKKIMFSRRAMVELGKNLLKVIVISFVAYLSLKTVIEQSLNLMDSDVISVLLFKYDSMFSVAIKISLAFIVIAILDYSFQKAEHERDLRMTKKEVKDEQKTTEGDPLIKGRIRTIQREIAYKRMMQEVPNADVVVTNPKHLAVALKYDPEEMNAPKLIAKGAELIAQRIKEIALEHNIPIVEDKFLARTIFKTVEIGEEIPEKLFRAVAEILAYIYKMKNKTYSKGFGY